MEFFHNILPPSPDNNKNNIKTLVIIGVLLYVNHKSYALRYFNNILTTLFKTNAVNYKINKFPNKQRTE